MFRWRRDLKKSNAIYAHFIQIFMYSQNIQSKKTCLNITKTTTKSIYSQQLCLRCPFVCFPGGAHHLGQHIQYLTATGVESQIQT